ncbi:signal transduction histidine kinase [Catenuloplanes nepalensis]|uniref:histidine kinase n=1 Tax=Catenuloplanes nepalensis TaxID=587533 RepID=A0ABT9MZB4_9ACTN|nr:sensor histidine kinase [Catenuloplanes nepalensis]MDP9796784.1 signal transduction histidine kinase [Catenuloplanes nepalensis]
MRTPPWLADVLIGVAVTGTLAAVISARHGGEHAPDPIAYAWAGGLGALMLARRHHPRAVLLISALGLCAYYAAGYPAVGVAVPLAAALFSTAEAGFLLASVLTAGGVLAISLTFRLLEGQSVNYVIGYDLVSHVTLMAAAIALGDGLRSRRAQRTLHMRENHLRVREERLAIARDLHDSVGHGVSVISLHADVAREAAPPGNEALDEALLRIRQAADLTMAELRGAVGALRGTVSLTGLSPVLDTARSAGYDVATRIPPEVRDLPPEVDAAAYRIVQEAVTNVVRHASTASRVSVDVRITGGRLRLTIADDGPAGTAGDEPGDTAADGIPGGGHGLAGMAERARALGGTLRTRHTAEGFTVEAELPLGRTA